MVFVLGSGACGVTLSTETTPEQSAATIAVFAPNGADPCKSVLPFPTDMVRDPAAGTLAGIPFCADYSPDKTAMVRGLRTLSGFSINTAIYAPVSGAIDETSLAEHVVLRDATGPVAHTLLWSAEQKRVFIKPNAPLEAGKTYFVALTRGIKATDGAELVRDQAFTLLASTDPLTDSAGYSRYAAIADDKAFALEPLRRNYFMPLLDGLEKAGIARKDVLVGWSFTTQPIATALSDLDKLMQEPAVFEHENKTAAATHPLLVQAGIPATSLCDIHTGRAVLKTVLSDTDTITGTLRPISVDYLFVTPKIGADCTTPWPYDKLLVFAHGLGRCKNDALALADSFAKLGFATLALDGPRAGGRAVSLLGDQNLDGCVDQPKTPELIATEGNEPSPFNIRDRVRFWGLELVQAAEGARLAPASLLGATATGTEPKPSVVLVGHSWGGIAGILAGAVADMQGKELAQPPAISMVAVNAAVGALAQSFGPAIRAGLVAKNPTATTATIDGLYTEAITAWGWALEATDPVYFNKAYSTVKVLVQTVAHGDDATTAALHDNASQLALANGYGFTDGKTSFSVVCTTAGSATPLCPDGSGAVGALLKPCVAATDAKYPLLVNKLTRMRTQLLSFVASGGSCVGAYDAGTQACDANYVDLDEACP